MTDWSYFGLFFLVLIVLVGAADLIRRGLGWPVEVTRKSVHVITGILVSITPFLFVSPVPLLVLAGIFIVLNFAGVQLGLFAGMHATQRVSYGTVFFPLAFVVLLLWLWNSHPVAIVASMLVLGIADAVAAVTGERAKRPLYFRWGLERKSVQGSLAMFFASFLVVLISLVAAAPFLGDVVGFRTALLASGLAAFLATAAEAISAWGSDNLTAPLAAALVVEVFLEGGPGDQSLLLIGTLFAFVVAGGAYAAGFLDGGGAALTFLLGSIVFGLGGWPFAAPILAFFVLSSLLSKVVRRFRANVVREFEKADRRDVLQVLANGGVAGLLVLVWHWTKGSQVYLLYLASLAAVTADTWATEIGVWVGMEPRSVIGLRPLPVGTSGGVTLPGLAAAFLGATVIGVVAYFSRGSEQFLQFMPEWVWLLGAVGMLASLVDSVLGLTLQAQYSCRICGKLTEKAIHCGAPAIRARGASWVNNDVVNAICATAGVLLAWVAWQAFGP